MKKITRSAALAALIAALVLSALAAFAGTQIVSVRVRPGTKMYFEAKVDFLVTVDEVKKHSGNDNIYLDTGSLMFRNQIMSGYVTGRTAGQEAIYLIKSMANDYITLRITIANDAPLMSPGNTAVSSINNGNSDVVLTVGQMDSSSVSFFSVSELASDNTAVATTVATADSSVSGAYKINITGVSDGNCNVSFKAATSVGGTVQPFKLSVMVGNGTSTVDTTLDKLMPKSVSVGVGQTYTKQLSYYKVGFLKTTGSSSNYVDSVETNSASVSYNSYSGILTIIGKSVGYDSVSGQYALGAQGDPQQFVLSINVQQSAVATAAPVATPTPAPAKQVGLKIGSRRDGATLSYSFAKYQKKIVKLASTIKVDGVVVTPESLTWVSSNPAVITVDASGKIRFAGTGTSVLTVSTADGKYKVTFNFSVT